MVPSSQGIPESLIQDTLVISYNDEEELDETFKIYGTDIAAVIVEPIAANMGVVFPKKNYLKKPVFHPIMLEILFWTNTLKISPNPCLGQKPYHIKQMIRL